MLVVGVGALGLPSHLPLVGGGCGFVRLVDRDFIELDNLQRQALFDEQDIAVGLPKAVAAAEKLRRANSDVTVEPVVADVTSANVLSLIQGCDVVLDGCDNFETRLLLNDACLKLHVPWIYGAAIGISGATMTFVPGQGPFTVASFTSSPPRAPCPPAKRPESSALSRRSWQHSRQPMIKLLIGRAGDVVTQMRFVDAWTGTVEAVEIRKGDASAACNEGTYDFLERTERRQHEDVRPRRRAGRSRERLDAPDFRLPSKRLSPTWDVSFNEYRLRFRVGDKEIVLFPDGRAIIKGDSDEAAARSLYARFIGA